MLSASEQSDSQIAPVWHSGHGGSACSVHILQHAGPWADQQGATLTVCTTHPVGHPGAVLSTKSELEVVTYVSRHQQTTHDCCHGACSFDRQRDNDVLGAGLQRVMNLA